MLNAHFLIRPALGIAALVLGNSAHATVFCVTTGTQLYNNLQTAQSNGVDDEIRIRTGTMTGTGAVASNPRWSYRPSASDNSTSLSISGGWNSTCASQTLDPGLTQLDAQNGGTALDFDNLSGDPLSAQISVRNLTLARGASFSPGKGAGLYYNVDATVSTSLVVENVLVTSSIGVSGTSGNSAMSVKQSGAGFVRIRNVVLSNNSLGSTGSGGLAVNVSENTVAYISNNSIFGNSGSLGGSGLLLSGNLFASNNVVAGNSSSGANSSQVFAATSTGIVLRNNHFGSQFFAGNNHVETGTTTGDPQWDFVGSIAVPKAVSVLRDSGTNTPSGQLASTDYNGDARIVNAVVDRGAIEAALAPNVGPTISAVDPVPNSVTTLGAAVINTVEQFPILFSATGGTAPATTLLSCMVNNANVSLFPVNQSVAVGGNVQSVIASLTFTSAAYIAQVTCTASTNGNNNSFVFLFSVPAATTALGPIVTPMAPAANSTTALVASTLNQVISSNITFAAQSGDAGGSTSVQCAPQAGVIVVSANANQAVLSGSTVAPVTVSMSAGNQAQSATMRCTTKRVGEAPVVYDYNYTLNAIDSLFKNGFE